jgi:hypothetical protein
MRLFCTITTLSASEYWIEFDCTKLDVALHGLNLVLASSNWYDVGLITRQTAPYAG